MACDYLHSTAKRHDRTHVARASAWLVCSSRLPILGPAFTPLQFRPPTGSSTGCRNPPALTCPPSSSSASGLPHLLIFVYLDLSLVSLFPGLVAPGIVTLLIAGPWASTSALLNCHRAALSTCLRPGNSLSRATSFVTKIFNLASPRSTMSGLHLTPRLLLLGLPHPFLPLPRPRPMCSPLLTPPPPLS